MCSCVLVGECSCHVIHLGKDMWRDWREGEEGEGLSVAFIVPFVMLCICQMEHTCFMPISLFLQL